MLNTDLAFDFKDCVFLKYLHLYGKFITVGRCNSVWFRGWSLLQTILNVIKPTLITHTLVVDAEPHLR